jgi:hypothetical protein
VIRLFVPLAGASVFFLLSLVTVRLLRPADRNDSSWAMRRCCSSRRVTSTFESGRSSRWKRRRDSCAACSSRR